MSSYPNLGKYQIVEELGRGGMGAVYKGYDPLLERTVAIKLLAPHLVWEKDFVERFLREARAAARLDHPNIIHIYDVGHDDSHYYFVMAYLPGPSLKQFISQKRRLTLAEAVPILRQLAEALDYAHSKELIHRDVKPANVMFNERGLAVLTDFGIAKAAQESKLTMTGATMGTPQYMAPEQIQGKTIDARADQYMLGIVAFEMLTGSVPFDADTTPAIFYKQVNDPPPSAVALCADLPPAIEVVLNRALAKLPDDRYPSCGEFVHALEQVLALLVAPTRLMRPGYEKPSELTPTLPFSQLPADHVADRQKPILGPAAALPHRAERKPLPLLLAGVGIAAVVLTALVVVAISTGKGKVTSTPIAAVQPTLASTNTAVPPTNTQLPTHTPLPTSTLLPTFPPIATPSIATVTPTTPVQTSTRAPTSESTITPTPTRPVSYFKVPINGISQLNEPRVECGNLKPGLHYLRGIPFNTGWIATTQCGYMPERPDVMRLSTDVPSPKNIYVFFQGTATDSKFFGKEIGTIIAKFSNGQILSISLVLGMNIRDWAIGRNSVAVTTTTSATVQEACRNNVDLPPPESKTVIGVADILTIKIPENDRKADLTEIEIWDKSTSITGGPDPCIHLLGITVEYLH